MKNAFQIIQNTLYKNLSSGNRFILVLIVSTFSWAGTFAQPADTVTVDLASSSKVVFTMKDPRDLPVLRGYDFQALFDDILWRLEHRDTISTTGKPLPAMAESSTPVKSEPKPYDEPQDIHLFQVKSDESTNRFLFNFDLGLNYLTEDGQSPSSTGKPYAVKPWGSWYVGLNSVHQTRFKSIFTLEWSVGVSWYNFKFEDPSMQIHKTDEGVEFVKDTRDVTFQKSKLTASYLNVMLMPGIRLGGRYKMNKKNVNTYAWDAFRLGIGAYAGHRLGSYSRQRYQVDGTNESDKFKSNFYLQDLRYGLRVQFGFANTVDFFFNYDLNPLFAEEKGPHVNAWTFGLIF